MLLISIHNFSTQLCFSTFQNKTVKKSTAQFWSVHSTKTESLHTQATKRNRLASALVVTSEDRSADRKRGAAAVERSEQVPERLSPEQPPRGRGPRGFPPPEVQLDRRRPSAGVRVLPHPGTAAPNSGDLEGLARRIDQLQQ